ncbi:hypothetical protein OSB04_028579, partial [Centaurea solstitialis]
MARGDPLVPFLFLLAAKGINQACKIALERKLIKGVEIASGLTINMSKNSVLGIGTTQDEVERMAAKLGCKVAATPFKYLGLPIGCNMARISNWSLVIEKFKSRLSGWKAKNLSSGGRLVLVKSVLRRHVRIQETPAQLDCQSTKEGERTRSETRWSSLIPKKISIFIWRVAKERILVRTLMDRCEIDVPSLLCPLCEKAVKNLDHVLVRCRVSYQEVWLKFFSCWGFQDM